MRAATLLSGSLGLLIAVASPAGAADVESLPGEERRTLDYAQQCLRDLQSFEQKLEEVGFGILPPDGYGVAAPAGYYLWGVEGTPRQKIRSLRDAAYVYAWGGEEALCQTVLDSMRDVYREHQTLVGPEADDPDLRTAWRRAHLSRAQRLREMDHLMRADILIGAEIRNLEDEKLGEIEDLVVNPDQREILYVLASRGGFLGMGEKLIAIPWRGLRFTQDHELYVLDVPEQALEAAPKVDRANFEATEQAEWRRALAAYWDPILQR